MTNANYKKLLQINAVREVAPHVPEAWVVQDLRRTGSPQATLERIFERFPVADHEPERAENQPNHRAVVQEVQLTNSQEDTVESVLAEIKALEEKIPVGFASTPSEREKLLKDRKELMTKKAKLFVLFLCVLN